ncbi:MAG: peptidase domain-containing ABC transporter [Aulosira sp. ZfuVER01]|nr:peptidase domain-containing ABC transporter [Aulosira sp. ZfuVER01]MDZ7998389.1 peptidase domain-containing ABC transporter [Aulosira sp. DedVER01a]MDZ8050166.1 peptidase domain-containing ABC transporter [Aulosira sp. ZfuCHP01]
MPYQLIRQHSEEDCGAACLATIAKHYGRIFSLNRVREAVGTGQLGTSLLGLKRGAEVLGFNARGVRVAPEILDKLQEIALPAIIHWQGYHWVVLYGCRGKKYVIADPAVGIRYLLKDELMEGWANRLMLILEPDSVRFFAQESDRIHNFRRFIQPVWNYRAILGEAFLINIFVGMLSLISPFLLQILTDDVLVRGDTKLLANVVLAAIVMNFLSSSLRLVQSNLITHFSQRLQLGLVLEFGRQILRLPLTYYESHRSGEIITRLRDIQEINQLVSQSIIGLPSQFFIALVSLGLMFFYSGKLTLLALVFAVLMTISTFIFLPILQQKTQTLLVLEAENQGILVETFKGAITFKSLMAAPQLWEEFQSQFGRVANLAFKTMQISAINNIFSGLVFAISSILLLWFGSSLAIAREITIGQLLAFSSMNNNFLGFISTVIGFANGLVQARNSIQRVTEVLDVTPENQGDEQKPWVKFSSNSDIVCINLNFHHTGRVDLLKDFSLTIPGGKIVALVGQSGCGKSTLAKLITGFYPLQSGNIRIGDYNLQDISLDSLRQQIVLIPQEAHFWSRSIIENFRLTAPYVNFESIVQACKLTGADEFISRLPDKYQTVLGEFGANISGGQRQRLAIARAIVCNPPILLMDESTGALDPASELYLLDQLLSDRAGKTTILISHRPQVIQHANWIVVLNEGQLITQGCFKDLQAQPANPLFFLNC